MSASSSEPPAGVRHEHPYRLFDRVIEADGERCTVVKTVTADETLQVDRAVPDAFPTALVVEALAQAAVPLAGAGGAGFLLGMDKVRLHVAVRPGAVLRITAAVVARLGEIIRVAARAEVEGRVVAEGEFTFAVGRLP
jgi:3-hydroxyacyl-[acyl-carrier-protein] dehydratase